MTRLNIAIKMAVDAHGSQLDKVGLPYILHPLRVMNAIKEHGEDMMCAAVLHDTLEDTELKFKDIHTNFGDFVANTVLELSRRKYENETYSAFIERVRLGSSAVQFIKIADLRDNLGRISILPESERTIAHRYIRALKTLGVTYEA